MAETTVLRHAGSPQRPSTSAGAGVQTSGPLPMVNVSMGGAGGKQAIVNGAGGSPHSGSVVVLPAKGYRGAAPAVAGGGPGFAPPPGTGYGAFGPPAPGTKVEIFGGPATARGGLAAGPAQISELSQLAASLPSLPDPPFTKPMLELLQRALAGYELRTPEEFELRKATGAALLAETELVTALDARAAEEAQRHAARVAEAQNGATDWRTQPLAVSPELQAQLAAQAAQLAQRQAGQPIATAAPMIVTAAGARGSVAASAEAPRRVTRTPRPLPAPPITSPGERPDEALPKGSAVRSMAQLVAEIDGGAAKAPE